jgi:hypothetical protein
VELDLKDTEENHDVCPTLKDSNYGNLNGRKENNEDRRSMNISKEIQEMEECTNEDTRGFEVSEKKQDQWDKNEDALSIEVSDENGVKVEHESGETLCLQHSELKNTELSTPEERPSSTNIRELATALCIVSTHVDGKLI